MFYLAYAKRKEPELQEVAVPALESENVEESERFLTREELIEAVRSGNFPPEGFETNIQGEAKKTGVLLIVKLSDLFRMVTYNEDVWPEIDNFWDIERKESYTMYEGTPYEIEVPGEIIDFKKARVLFGTDHVEHVNMSVDYKSLNRSGLIWYEGNGKRLCHKSSFAFDVGGYTKIHENINNIWSESRPGIVYYGTPYFAWRDKDTRIMVGNWSRIYADTIETTGTGPSLHLVTDTLANRQVVLGWFGTDSNKSMNHRLLFLSPFITDIARFIH